MFSIVIPLYNKAKSIATTIQSVLGQSFADFELIIVDDGSTDDSVRVVNQFTDKRIRLIQKENGGVCSARNVGIAQARYEFIALLDADDYWDTDYLFEQQKLITDFPQAAMWGINFAPVVNREIHITYRTGLPSGFRGIVQNYFTIQGRISDLFCSSSVVVKKDIFDRVGGFDERIKYAEDIDVWYRIIADYSVVFYDRIMVYYQFDAQNRALNINWSLIHYLPFYVGKYSRYKGMPFYVYIHRWCAVKIKYYYFNVKEERENAKIASADLDYTVLPIKYKYFFRSPYFIGYIIYILTELKLKIQKCIN